jgi:hypothetical protein
MKTLNRITYITYMPLVKLYTNKCTDVIRGRALTYAEAQSCVSEAIQQKCIVTEVHHLSVK